MWFLFQIFQSQKIIIKKKTILNLKFKITPHNMKLLRGFWISSSGYFWEYFFLRLGIWKTNCTFWKKATFSSRGHSKFYQNWNCLFRFQQNETKFPLRWMAPETLETMNNFTEKSDVWSFGTSSLHDFKNSITANLLFFQAISFVYFF